MTEEKAESPVQEESTEDFAAMLAAHSASSGRLQPGQKVSGVVIAITGDSVFVDVGIKVDGIMDRKDILDAEGKESAGPGDSVEAWVIAVSPQEIRLARGRSRNRCVQRRLYGGSAGQKRLLPRQPDGRRAGRRRFAGGPRHAVPDHPCGKPGPQYCGFAPRSAGSRTPGKS